MIPVFIDDPDDPRVAPYRAIRERDLVGRGNRFIAEGKVVLNVLFAARRFPVDSVLILESRLEGMAETLAAALDGTPVYVATPAVMDAIAGFHVHRGVLAAGRRRQAEAVDAVLAGMPANALVVALVGISNHDNMGAIFRNAAAFEADAVLLDRTCCDPLYRKSIRVSVGAALRIPYAVAEDGAALAAALDGCSFEPIALTPHGAEEIAAVRPGGRQALFLGAEGPGLPDDLLRRLRTVRIGMAAGFDSLNVAAASAIALHRLWRGRASAAE